MKRINLIFISEEITIKPGDIKPEDVTPEMTSQLMALEGMLADNPQLANDPEIKILMSIKADMDKAFPPSGETVTPAATTTTPAATTTTPAADTKTIGLEALPFFGGTGVAATDFKGVKPEQLTTVAPKLGYDTAQPDWFEKFIGDFASTKQEVARAAEYKTELEEVTAGINALPKEIQQAIQAIKDGKDWKTVIGAASTLDLTKDFKGLSDTEKINVHNYFFPEDKIEAGADLTDKANAKALSAAASKFTAEKTQFENQKETTRIKSENTTKAWTTSIEDSKSAFVKQFPQFKAEQLTEINDTIAKKGIASLFVDKNGVMTKEGFERVAFALYGADVLKAAVAIAQNKGASAGKAEVLATTQTDGNKGGGGQAATLTDEEKAALKLLQESQVSTTLTY